MQQSQVQEDLLGSSKLAQTGIWNLLLSQEETLVSSTTFYQCQWAIAVILWPYCSGQQDV